MNSYSNSSHTSSLFNGIAFEYATCSRWLMLVREYLVDNFGFDDIQLMTLGIGKQTDANPDAGWGTVRILIYPDGTEIPPAKQT